MNDTYNHKGNDIRDTVDASKFMSWMVRGGLTRTDAALVVIMIKRELPILKELTEREKFLMFNANDLWLDYRRDTSKAGSRRG